MATTKEKPVAHKQNIEIEEAKSTPPQGHQITKR